LAFLKGQQTDEERTVGTTGMGEEYLFPSFSFLGKGLPISILAA
jgi:hypothetical protein